MNKSCHYRCVSTCFIFNRFLFVKRLSIILRKNKKHNDLSGTMNILLVEDDLRLARNLKSALNDAGYRVTVATDGFSGEEAAFVNDYDLIILDIMLPGKDGLSILQSLRAEHINTPVLILTARNRLEDKITGLDSGADDYLPKPFAIAELLARVRALLRRNSDVKHPVISVGELTVNTLTHEVRVRNQPIALTPKEYAILEFLLFNMNRVVSRIAIAEHVWDENFDLMTNLVDVHIKNLRKKILQYSQTPVIQTVRGVGYLIKNHR